MPAHIRLLVRFGPEAVAFEDPSGDAAAASATFARGDRTPPGLFRSPASVDRARPVSA